MFFSAQSIHPYWKQNARGIVVGLTRGCSRSHFIRATLESLAYQSYDIAKAMEQDSGLEITSPRSVMIPL